MLAVFAEIRACCTLRGIKRLMCGTQSLCTELKLLYLSKKRTASSTVSFSNFSSLNSLGSVCIYRIAAPSRCLLDLLLLSWEKFLVFLDFSRACRLEYLPLDSDESELEDELSLSLLSLLLRCFDLHFLFLLSLGLLYDEELLLELLESLELLLSLELLDGITTGMPLLLLFMITMHSRSAPYRL